MALIASYPTSNYSGTYQSLYGTQYIGRGQSFAGNGDILTSASFYLMEYGGLTGSAYAKVYASSGTYGVTGSAIPTGTALATSNAFDTSTITTTITLESFTFTGANQITLANGTDYVLTIEYTNAGSTYLEVGMGTTTPTGIGNSSYDSSGTWSVQTTQWVIFYLYGNVPVTANSQFFPFMNG